MTRRSKLSLLRIGALVCATLVVWLFVDWAAHGAAPTAVTVSWSAPTKWSDGAAIADGALRGFNVYTGAVHGAYDNRLALPGTARSAVIATPARVYIVVTSVAQLPPSDPLAPVEVRESAYSTEIVATPGGGLLTLNFQGSCAMSPGARGATLLLCVPTAPGATTGSVGISYQGPCSLANGPTGAAITCRAAQ